MPYKHGHYFVGAVLIVILGGFWASYFAPIGAVPLAFHVHAFTAMSWLLLLIVQHVSIHRRSNAFHKQMGGFPDGMKVDRWQVTHYGPPSFVRLDIGSAPVGTPVRQGERGKGVNMWNLNTITPETEKTAHYFFAQAYNFKLDQRWVSDLVKSQVIAAFLEDMAMIKAQQLNIDLGPSPVVNLGQDKAWIIMRQIVDRLIKEESAQARAA